MTTTETEAAAVPLTGQQYQITAGRYRARAGPGYHWLQESGTPAIAMRSITRRCG
jgi:hypothetical protein